MKNDNDVLDEAQGVESIPEVSTIKKWMTRDLGACIVFLKALQDDPNLQDVMATYLQGRISNFKNKPDPSQMPSFDRSPKGVA